ncbi:speckle-type POZ protein-like [Copidosoma floridanum]|uniref:speckle-type POZ protein-like n=1 Tax=Copidosoma floridanum TaxID=29053 RepID=UPI0006C98BDB|nr:speckle-type POZ protein-like [Copidosoma floridanum]
MSNTKSSVNYRWIIVTFVVLCTFPLHSESMDPATITTVPETFPLQSVDKWSVTKVNAKKITYAWTIMNFSVNNKLVNEYLESPIFTIDDEYQWRLRFYPSVTYGKYTKLHLYLLPAAYRAIPITYEFGLVNSTYGFYFPKDKATATRVSPSSSFGYDEFIDVSSLKNFTKNDQLTIIAKLAMHTGYTNYTSGSCDSAGLGTPDHDHTDNFENLLDNPIFSDVTFKIRLTEIKAHKAILATMSPVLMSEFIKLQEFGKKAVMEFDDVEPKSFKDMLRFVYTGKVEKIEKTAKDLLPLAKRFGIKQLEDICERALCKTLNLDNVMDMFNLASNINATYLKVQAIKYMTAHTESMMDAPNFASLMSQPQNLIGVLRALINNPTTP